MTLINIGMDITPDKTLLYVDPVKTSVYRRTVHKAWLLRMKKANGPLKLTMSSRRICMILYINVMLMKYMSGS